MQHKNRNTVAANLDCDSPRVCSYALHPGGWHLDCRPFVGEASGAEVGLADRIPEAWTADCIPEGWSEARGSCRRDATGSNVSHRSASVGVSSARAGGSGRQVLVPNRAVGVQPRVRSNVRPRCGAMARTCCRSRQVHDHTTVPCEGESQLRSPAEASPPALRTCPGKVYYTVVIRLLPPGREAWGCSVRPLDAVRTRAPNGHRQPHHKVELLDPRW